MLNGKVGSDFTTVRIFYAQSYLMDVDEISYWRFTIEFLSCEFYIMSFSETLS
jgi:hypothetical protein